MDLWQELIVLRSTAEYPANLDFEERHGRVIAAIARARVANPEPGFEKSVAKVIIVDNTVNQCLRFADQK